MFKWIFLLFLLTTGAVFYHYPGLIDVFKDRIPIWLGIKKHDVLYRWQDEYGVIKVGPNPPADRPYEKLQIRHDHKDVKKTTDKSG